MLINLITWSILAPVSLGYSSCVDAASMMDGTGINAGNRDHPASVMHPPTKRHKLYAFLVHPMWTHMFYGYFDIITFSIEKEILPKRKEGK